LNKAELIDSVAGATSVTKVEAERVLDAFFDTLTGELKRGNKVAWPGIGSFSVTQRAARMGRNPQTGAPVQIAASKAVKFTASSTLKSAVKGGAAAKKAAKAPAKKGAKKAAKKAAKKR
jgi:DNA-binding protein HU-beta